MAEIDIDNETFSDQYLENDDKRLIAQALLDSGDVEAIREACVYVPDPKDPSTWAGLHHMLVGNTLTLARYEVYRISGMLEDENAVGWPRTARVAALAHARKHLQTINEAELSIPEADTSGGMSAD